MCMLRKTREENGLLGKGILIFNGLSYKKLFNKKCKYSMYSSYNGAMIKTWTAVWKPYILKKKRGNYNNERTGY